MLVSLTRADGGHVGIDPTTVAEINRARPPHTFVCFKGGSNEAVTETVEQLIPLFCPPMIILRKLTTESVLVAADCIIKVNEGDFHGRPCVWLVFDRKHKRRAIAVLNPYPTVVELLSLRQSA